MATTQYTIAPESGDAFAPVTKGKKAAAIELASSLAKEHKGVVLVTTGTGTLVFTAKARKAQKKTPRYTRIDSHELDLAEGVKLPKGFDLAYVRPRVGLALLRKVTKGADGFTVDYAVFNQANGAKIVVNTTREAGQVFAQVRKGDLELTA